MNCPKGHIMPDNVMLCPVCTTESGDRALRVLQIEFLTKAKRGDFSYWLRVAKAPTRHVIMFDTDKRAFCGSTLDSKPRLDYLPFDDITLAKVCAGCRMEIARLMEGVAV